MARIERYHCLDHKAIAPEALAKENGLLCWRLEDFEISPSFVCEDGVFVTGSEARAFGYKVITGEDYPYDHYDRDFLTIGKPRVYDNNNNPVKMRRIATCGVGEYLRRTQFNIDQALTDGRRLFVTLPFWEGMRGNRVVFSECYSGAFKRRDGVWELTSQKGLFRFLLFRIMWGGEELGFTFPEIDKRTVQQLINKGLDREELKKYVKASKFHGIYEEFKEALSALGLTV